ncbi:AAA family ATPase [Microbispora sp. NPDC049125]|uniref:AAA family ATPase n=1 Tax=Microbispora sp. NPDC049125 TaxID=3154929 RepID=UPI003466CF12
MATNGGHLRLQILGPLRLWRDGVELDAGPRQQAYLLALLLARAGEPISVGELIDLIWDQDTPASAVNILHKYVGALRRLLEPGLPARETGSYLHRRGNGYLFVAGPGILDVVEFRELVEAARAATAGHRPDVALDRYVEALGIWRGPAGDGPAHGPASMSVFGALDDEFFSACLAAAELALPLEQPARILHPLHLAARMAPLDENVQASLISALAADGRPAEALALFSTVRVRLADDLGIAPGTVLTTAHQGVLGHVPAREPPPAATHLVGRDEELTVLRQVVGAALTGETGLVLVEGEPGVGKTRLLEEAAAEAEQRGALVVWGRCLEGEGTPSMWPWVQVVGAMLDRLPEATRATWRAGDLGRLVAPDRAVSGTPVLPDSGARFRLFEGVVALIGRVSAGCPVVLVVDDLQWADVASLELFGHLADRLPHGTVVIGALRDRAPMPGSELARMLAAASRLPWHRRIGLGLLRLDETAELVRRETGRDPDPDAARVIHARTAGNPFFVRELSRFWNDNSVHGVPSTVRDVVRDRIAGLDDRTGELLQVAALIGREVDLTLLARAADVDVPGCLDGLEPLEALGLLEPSADDPHTFRFAHDLVREAVAGTTPQRRLARLHLRVAEALEHTVPGDDSVAERLAHHLRAAGPLADPSRTAAALIHAGRCAGGKSALDTASDHVRSAAQVARTAGLAELELSALALLIALDGMRAGYVGNALEVLERAEHLARDLGREREATDFLFSRWAAYSQGIQLDRAGRLAHRLLTQGQASADPIVHTYGLHAWGIHQWDVGNIGEALRYLSRSAPAMLQEMVRREDDPLRHDLQLLSPVMLALMTGLHGDVDDARAQLDMLEAAADGDPYVVTVCAAFAVTVAALAGDPVWARSVAERGIALDPEFSFVFLGSYQRLAHCWARAVTGDDPVGAAAEAQAIIDVALTDPPRSGLTTWYGLLGEMWLAAGRLDDAGKALDRADRYLDVYGQRYPEGFVILMRARLMERRGAPVSAVRAEVERARALSLEREAHLFVHRADQILGRRP